MQHTCNCQCAIHHGNPRRFFTDPGCRCLISYASQPLTLHSPQTGGALFLDRDARLWHVPSLEPGHWDWNRATHADSDYPLIAAEMVTELLLIAADELAEPGYDH
jgi:hypothetical protein